MRLFIRLGAGQGMRTWISVSTWWMCIMYDCVWVHTYVAAIWGEGTLSTSDNPLCTAFEITWVWKYREKRALETCRCITSMWINLRKKCTESSPSWPDCPETVKKYLFKETLCRVHLQREINVSKQRQQRQWSKRLLFPLVISGKKWTRSLLSRATFSQINPASISPLWWHSEGQWGNKISLALYDSHSASGETLTEPVSRTLALSYTFM